MSDFWTFKLSAASQALITNWFSDIRELPGSLGSIDYQAFTNFLVALSLRNSYACLLYGFAISVVKKVYSKNRYGKNASLTPVLTFRIYKVYCIHKNI